MDTCGLKRVERFRINLNEKNFASQKNTLRLLLRNYRLHHYQRVEDVLRHADASVMNSKKSR